MNKTLAAAVACVALATPVAAQELLGGYFTMINFEDTRNSKGVPLRDFCAIVQQDRANFHRFGLRDELDEWDAWFGTPDARRIISANCFIAPGSEYIPSAVLRGEPRYLRVQVFGRGGVPQWVEIHEGAG